MRAPGLQRETCNPERETLSMEIAEQALDALHAHAREAWPNECCGLLIGTASRIERAIRARNLRESPTRYLIDPADHLAAIREARAVHREVVGAYHSHPASPPLPSDTDRSEATYADYVYVIVTPALAGHSGDARAYRFVDGQFAPLDLVPVGRR